MKRALAERVKQQKEQAAAAASTSLGLGATGSGSGPVQQPQPQPQSSAFLHQRQQQPHQQQRQQSIDMRVEAVQPPRKIPRIKSNSPRTPTIKPNSNASPNANPNNATNSTTTATTGTTSSTSAQSSSRKKNGMKSKGATNSSKYTGNTTTNTNNNTNSNPKKRSRPSSSSTSILHSPLSLPIYDDDDDNDGSETDSKFFLKYQNRALASELYNYKHAIMLLERERNVRREECQIVYAALRDLVSNWNGMEAVLMGAIRDNDGSGDGDGDTNRDRDRDTNTGADAGENGTCTNNSRNTTNTCTSNPSIVHQISSTGNGKNVEHIYSIMETIAQLSNSSTAFTFTCDDHQHEFKEEGQVQIGGGHDGSYKGIKRERESEIEADTDTDSQHRHQRQQPAIKKEDLIQRLQSKELEQKQHYKNLELDSKSEQLFLKHLSDATGGFSKRILNFEKLLLYLIQHSLYPNTHTHTKQRKIKLEQKQLNRTSSKSKNDTTALLQLGKLTKQLSTLQSENADLQTKMADLAKDRDVCKDSERRVRRGLYRVATGRMKIAEVLKAVEESSSLDLEDLEELQKDILSSSKSKGGGGGGGGGNDSTSNANADGTSSDPTNSTELSAITIDGKILSIDDVMEMERKIDDLSLVNESRSKKIDELLTEKEAQEKKINLLLLKATSESVKDEDIKTSPLFIGISSKLSVAERENEELKKELISVKARWATTKGDLQLSRKTLDDLEEKHKRRLMELSGEAAEGSDSSAGEKMHLAEKIVKLEHKLKHALDRVRQAEAMKVSLCDATTMKETLQRQVQELRARNNQLEVSTEASGQVSSSPSPSSHKDAGKDSITKEKLHRMKKEMNALMHSKEQAKQKLDRSEKECDSLMGINIRLQQQSAEKDDMNAKSLSTILHLRQLSEQLEQEKIMLERKLKSAEQLAVMARLAAKAKDKVEKEAMQEKENAEKEGIQLKSDLEDLVKQNDEIEGELNLAKSQIQKAREDAESLKERCGDLVSSLTAREKEIKKMSEDLIVAKKEAVEAKQKAVTAEAEASGSTGNFNSEFTAEQLTIQVNQLKSRLACPVCNTRDKKVIINRCRHMFCRHCVELNLGSRNRKCPSCGIRFDRKDVEDVWF